MLRILLCTLFLSSCNSSKDQSSFFTGNQIIFVSSIAHPFELNSSEISSLKASLKQCSIVQRADKELNGVLLGYLRDEHHHTVYYCNNGFLSFSSDDTAYACHLDAALTEKMIHYNTERIASDPVIKGNIIPLEKWKLVKSEEDINTLVRKYWTLENILKHCSHNYPISGDYQHLTHNRTTLLGKPYKTLPKELRSVEWIANFEAGKLSSAALYAVTVKGTLGRFDLDKPHVVP